MLLIGFLWLMQVKRINNLSKNVIGLPLVALYSLLDNGIKSQNVSYFFSFLPCLSK